MSLTITQDMMRLQEAAESMGYAGNSATARMLRQIEEIERVQKQMEAINAAERIARQVEEIRQQALEPLRTVKDAYQRGIEQCRRSLKHFDDYMRYHQELVLIERLRRQLHIVRYRSHGAPASKVKVSFAKKSAKSAGSSSSGGSGGGGDGGDSGGDGDGPQRTRSTPKKSRSSKSVITRPPRLPSNSPGKTAPTPSSKVSPNRPQPSRVIAILAMILLFGISLITSHYLVIALIVIGLTNIALTAMGYPDVAKVMWRSVPDLFKYLTKRTDEKNEDPDEES